MKDAEKIFNGASSFYSRYRPTYPHNIIETLSKVTGFNGDWMVADVGSGTGILSSLFLENGNHASVCFKAIEYACEIINHLPVSRVILGDSI